MNEHSSNGMFVRRDNFSQLIASESNLRTGGRHNGQRRVWHVSARLDLLRADRGQALRISELADQNVRRNKGLKWPIPKSEVPDP